MKYALIILGVAVVAAAALLDEFGEWCKECSPYTPINRGDKNE